MSRYVRGLWIMNDETTQFIFPFPPSVNTMYFQGKNHGQKFASGKAKAYKKMLQTLHADPERVPILGHLHVTTLLVPPTTNRRDIDNFQKALLDGLTELNIIGDDSQIVELNTKILQKIPRYNRGFAVITIRKLDISKLDILLDMCKKAINKLFSSSGLSELEMLSFIKPTKKNPLYLDKDES